MKTIETHARTFLTLNILAIGRVLDLTEQKAGSEAAATQRSRLSKTYGGGPVYHEYPMNVKNS